MSDMTMVTSTDNFSIWMDAGNTWGYFEHNRRGDNCAGGLWFENNALIDYDGVFEMPSEVLYALADIGFVVDIEFF